MSKYFRNTGDYKNKSKGLLPENVADLKLQLQERAKFYTGINNKDVVLYQCALATIEYLEKKRPVKRDRPGQESSLSSGDRTDHPGK